MFQRSHSSPRFSALCVSSHRLAYSEPVMRLTVVAVALVFFGLLMAIGDLLN